MISFVFGVSGLVVLFGYLSATNPLDPTLVDSLIRSSISLIGTVGVGALIFFEIKLFNLPLIRRLTR